MSAAKDLTHSIRKAKPLTSEQGMNICMRFSLIVVFCCLHSTVWAADPVLGTWNLNLAKSTYKPGPAPKSQTRIYEAHPQGVKVTIKTIDAEGKSTSIEHPVNYDGKEHPVTGSSQTDAIALEKIDEYTSEATLKHAGKVIGSKSDCTGSKPA